MAQYEHLPLFKSSYDLLLKSYSVTKHFPKEYKYTIGENIKELSLDLIIMLYNINSTKEILKKRLIISEAIIMSEKLKLLFRISKDIKILSLKSFTETTISIVDVLRQLEGWKKSFEKINHI